MRNPPTCLLVHKMPVNEIPWSTFRPIPTIIDERNGINFLSCECKNTISNKKTVHNNSFARRQQRLTHPKHDSNVSLKLQVKLWNQLFRSILTLNNLCPPQNRGKLISDFTALITKWMWFLPDTHEPGGRVIVTFHYSLIRHIDPRWVELVCHIFFL